MITYEPGTLHVFAFIVGISDSREEVKLVEVMQEWARKVIFTTQCAAVAGNNDRCAYAVTFDQVVDISYLKRDLEKMAKSKGMTSFKTMSADINITP